MWLAALGCCMQSGHSGSWSKSSCTLLEPATSLLAFGGPGTAPASEVRQVERLTHHDPHLHTTQKMTASV